MYDPPMEPPCRCSVADWKFEDGMIRCSCCGFASHIEDAVDSAVREARSLYEDLRVLHARVEEFEDTIRVANKALEADSGVMQEQIDRILALEGSEDAAFNAGVEAAANEIATYEVFYDGVEVVGIEDDIRALKRPVKP